MSSVGRYGATGLLLLVVVVAALWPFLDAGGRYGVALAAASTHDEDAYRRIGCLRGRSSLEPLSEERQPQVVVVDRQITIHWRSWPQVHVTGIAHRPSAVRPGPHD